ncbi:MAG: acyl-CoA dehydrogenase family protein [Pseudonocardiaceae bacterium]
MPTSIYTDEHDSFRKTARDFLAKEVVPQFPDWDQAGLVPREFFTKLGELGVLGLQIPEEYGGGGCDSFLFSAIWAEETARAYVHLGGLSVHMNVVLPYFLAYANDEQKRRWLPGMAGGELMTAIAMTEPGTGSDLAGMATMAQRSGDHYLLNGAKTFITGGINADLVVVVARTSRSDNRRDGLSLLVVERDMPGFTRGRNLDKIGLKTQDTAELFFDDVEVPVANLLGEEGKAFGYLTGNLPQERLSIAVAAVAAAEAAVAATVDYVKERKAFGTPVSSFQNTKFELAACATEVDAGRAMLDRALLAHDAGELSEVDAAKLKIFCTELQGRVVDRCLQLFGGYGFMREYPIARMYTDARVTRIFGGTNEVLKTIIAKSLGL